MTRKHIDCRNYPSEMNCTLALSADSESELLEAAIQHAVAVHGHSDTPELRSHLRERSFHQLAIFGLLEIGVWLVAECVRHFPSTCSIFAKATTGSWPKLHHQPSAAARSSNSVRLAIVSRGNRSKALTQVGITCEAYWIRSAKWHQVSP